MRPSEAGPAVLGHGGSFVHETQRIRQDQGLAWVVLGIELQKAQKTNFGQGWVIVNSKPGG
jgi:hypothetical protein